MEVCSSELLCLLINLVNVLTEIKVTIMNPVFKNGILTQVLYGPGDCSQSWVSLTGNVKKAVVKKKKQQTWSWRCQCDIYPAYW